MSGPPPQADPVFAAHELNRRIQQDPANKSRIIRDFYSERVKAGDREGADLIMVIRDINEAHPTTPQLSEDRPPQSHVFTQARLKWAVPIGVAALLISATVGWYAYTHSCPDVRVPKSHFVHEQTQGHRRVVIFVHGVLGDMDNTWVNPTTHRSWPEMLSSDPAFSDYDVYVYGYFTPCNGSASNIYEIATRFGQQLKDDGFFRRYDEIHFVTHSMGGLITKMMLANLNTSHDFDELQRVRSAVFIAVPSGGADLASMATWFSSNPQFKNMDRNQAQALLQTIEGSWASIMRARDSTHPFPHSFVAYETKDLLTLRIVPALYTSSISDTPPVAFDYDHVSIVKPDSEEADIYRWTRQRIVESSSLSGAADSQLTQQIIQGTVVEGTTARRSLPDAEVLILETNDKTTTDSNGEFTLKFGRTTQIANGTPVHVRISHRGYNTKTWQITPPIDLKIVTLNPAGT